MAKIAKRPVFITGSVAALVAATMLTGCSSFSSSWSKPTASNSYGEFTTEAKAARAEASIDAAETKGSYSAEWFYTKANENQLPQVWLSEARQSVADIEARRAAAQAEQLQTQAERSKRLAGADAALTGAMNAEIAAYAEAGRTQESYAAEITKLSVETSAREDAAESEARRNDAFIAATQKQRNAEFQEMRSSAVKSYEQAGAEYNKMLAERQAVGDRGEAGFYKMTKIADMTEVRAQAKVASIREEAVAVDQQSGARVADLDQQIRTLTEQLAARGTELRQRASSLEEQANATASELAAQAAALESKDTKELYQLNLKAAELAFERAQAECTSLKQQAAATLTDAEAQVDRQRADAQQSLSISQADYDQQAAALEKYREQRLADVLVFQARAKRLETTAREEFVKAEAGALANAVREEAVHLAVLADEQYEQFRAQAEADAARIKAEVARTLAQQINAGSVEFPSKTTPVEIEAVLTSSEPTPEKPEVEMVPEVIEAVHVATFKISLAKVTALRTQADAAAQTYEITYDERSKKIQAWWRQQEAAFEQSTIEANANLQQARAESEALARKAGTQLQIGQAQFNRDIAESEALRKEYVAKITNLRAEAQAVAHKSHASVTQLLAEAQANDKGGAAEVRSLEARRNASQQRGAARVRSFRAEANALEASQAALVAQMRQEIDSTQRILQAELARLDQSASSFVQVARATYNEAVAVAENYAAKTEIEVAQMYAYNEADRIAAQADVEHMRQIVSSRELSSQADVERMLAAAEASRNVFEAYDIAQRAEIFAEADIREARTRSEYAIADAQEDSVRALFSSRVASVKADRNAAYAAQYLSEQETIARVERAVAAADAYRELSGAALASLQEKSANFETAARQNWDIRLAMPTTTEKPTADEWRWIAPTTPFEANRSGIAGVSEDE